MALLNLHSQAIALRNRVKIEKTKVPAIAKLAAAGPLSLLDDVCDLLEDVTKAIEIIEERTK